jgi:hypothetical protein
MEYPALIRICAAYEPKKPSPFPCFQQLYYSQRAVSESQVHSWLSAGDNFRYRSIHLRVLRTFRTGVKVVPETLPLVRVRRHDGIRKGGLTMLKV